MRNPVSFLTQAHFLVSKVMWSCQSEERGVFGTAHYSEGVRYLGRSGCLWLLWQVDRCRTLDLYYLLKVNCFC